MKNPTERMLGTKRKITVLNIHYYMNKVTAKKKNSIAISVLYLEGLRVAYQSR